MNKKLLICIALLAISGCSRDIGLNREANTNLQQGGDAIERCGGGSGTKHYPCSASIYEIAGFPQHYDSKYIETVAYYPGGGALSIYFNRDSADSHDMFSSILMKSSIDTDEGYILIFGEFQYDKSDQGSMSYRQFGLMNDVTLLRRMGSLAHTLRSCRQDKCRIDYSRSGGVHPELIRE